MPQPRQSQVRAPGDSGYVPQCNRRGMCWGSLNRLYLLASWRHVHEWCLRGLQLLFLYRVPHLNGDISMVAVADARVGHK